MRHSPPGADIVPFPHSRPPQQVGFERAELSRILDLYGRMVAAGEWRDYAMSFTHDFASFAAFRRTAEHPQMRVEKRPSLRGRQGMWVLAKAIIGESDWLASLWEKRARLSDKPVLILAGLKDPTFGPEKLARWQGAFPNHVTVTYPQVGHFVPEELGPEAVAPVERFVKAPIEVP